MIFDECFPPMLDTVERLGEWLDENPGETIPDMLGQHEFTVGGVAEMRVVRVFCQWMFQRPVDQYRSLTGADKERADKFLKGVGGYEGMQVNIRHRVKRVDHKLVPE
jgi:hypothetical protein